MTTREQGDPRQRRDTGRGSLSTSLLIDLTTISVDPAYVAAAARRADAGEEPARPARGGGWFVMIVVVIGLLAGSAARQTRLRAPELARTRAALEDRIMDLAEQTDADGRRLNELRDELDAQRGRSLAATEQGRALAEQLRALEQAVGVVAVRGPGVVVRLADAPTGTVRQPEDDSERVQDRDLQHVVNALWAAGAEAVSINDQRLGALTAIRQAGDAVLVDYRPLSSPYEISVIGDPDVVEPAFVASPIAGQLRTWSQVYRLGFSVRRAERLELPAAGGSPVQFATTVTSNADTLPDERAGGPR